MESAGTDFDKIAEEYRDADDAHRPYISSASDHFTLVLPDLTYEAGLNGNDLPVLTYAPVAGGTNHDGEVLSFCFYQAHKSADISAHLGVTDSSYFRKTVLNNLVGNGYLEKSKVSRAVFYRTRREMVTLR